MNIQEIVELAEISGWETGSGVVPAIFIPHPPDDGTEPYPSWDGFDEALETRFGNITLLGGRVDETGEYILFARTAECC